MKDVQSKINDLKILINDAVVIYIFNNLNFQFYPYFIILNYKA